MISLSNFLNHLILAYQDELTKSYTTFACQFKPGKVAPVGEGFRYVKHNYPDDFKSLYRRDGRHPALNGQYLTACVHFATIFGQPCLGNPYIPDNLDEETAKHLQIAADAAISQDNWNFDADSDCNLSISCEE